MRRGRRRARGKQLAIRFKSWGGKRKGSGPKPTGQFGCDARGRPRPGVSHRTRPAHKPRVPVHVTVRAVPGAPSLHRFAVARAIGRVLKRRARRPLACRVVHFSLQRDHLHLIVEADDRQALGRGLQGLLSGLARAANHAAGERGRGKLWRDRYHARPLRTPTEVRRAMVYVMRNNRKHGSTAFAVDPMSTSAWFNGFAGRTALRNDEPPVASPVTWLLAKGWNVRGGGPIRDDEQPSPVDVRR